MRQQTMSKVFSKTVAKVLGCASLFEPLAARAWLVLEFADEVDEGDVVFDDNDIKVVVDPKSLVYLDGTELDFGKEGLNEGIIFKNPNVKDECGCGESFNV